MIDGAYLDDRTLRSHSRVAPAACFPSETFPGSRFWFGGFDGEADAWQYARFARSAIEPRHWFRAARPKPELHRPIT
jgi:hypothetical protein